MSLFVIFGDGYLQEVYVNPDKTKTVTHIYANGTGSYPVTVRALNVRGVETVTTVAEVDWPLQGRTNVHKCDVTYQNLNVTSHVVIKLMSAFFHLLHIQFYLKVESLHYLKEF